MCVTFGSPCISTLNTRKRKHKYGFLSPLYSQSTLFDRLCIIINKTNHILVLYTTLENSLKETLLSNLFNVKPST